MKITRVNQKIFASSAASTELGKFGSLAAGNPETTADPSEIQSLQNFLDGWFSAVIGNNSPAIEDMNSLFYLSFRQIAYILQQGIAEWNAETEYHEGSWASDSNGNLYFSKINNNLNNILTDENSWAPIGDGIIKNKGHLLSSNGTKSLSVPPGQDNDLIISDSSKASGLRWGIDPITRLITTNWTYHQGDPNREMLWESVTYGEGLNLFVAVARIDSGSSNEMAMISYDGKRWEKQATPAGLDGWNSVTYGALTFVAVGSDGIMNSTDGESWTERVDPANGVWTSVAFGDGLFVAVSLNGSDVITSPDGVTWTERTPAAIDDWQSVTYGNGLFVAIASAQSGGSLPGRFMTSSDGINWTLRTPETTGVTSWRSITYGNGLFVAVSQQGDIEYSSDGINWNIATSSEDFAGLTSITYGNGVFLAVSSLGSRDVAFSSIDGDNWIPANTPSTSTGPFNSSVLLSSVTFGRGMFVAVADDAPAGEDVLTSLSMPRY